MDFGIFNLMGYRTVGTSTPDILRDTVELTRLADDGGIGMAWFAEHHFSNYCVCPSPLIMAAHCARTTTRIRLATGVLVLPLYSPPRLVAEIAMVDSMCDGRLVLGLGSGYQPFEFERFGQDLAVSKEMAEEFIAIIERGLTEEFIDFEGKHYRIRKTHIGPRPYRGVPDIWIAGDSPHLHGIAARKGYGMITNGRFANADGVAVRRPDFERPFLEEGQDPRQLKWGLLRFCCVTDSRAEALEYAENARWQLRLAGALRRREEVLDGHMLVANIPYPNEPTLEGIAANQMIGDVATCIERGVEEIRKTRAAHIAMYFQLGTYDNRRAMRSLEKFVTHVMPGIEKELGPLKDYPTSFEGPETRTTAVAG